jgi:hypothetical protein
MDEKTVEIYMPLLDEGVDVWRPVNAVHIEKNMYKIISINEDPDDEHWQFPTGDIVYCREIKFEDGNIGLVAINKMEDIK